MTNGEGKPGTPEPDPRASLVILLLLVLFVGAVVRLANSLTTANKTLECVTSGRTNCASVDRP